ncbi:MAG: radical SAM protein [SAR324 cluster bacterium]|nr:radical SAM protein [SAR324 cluster bacterium]
MFQHASRSRDKEDFLSPGEISQWRPFRPPSSNADLAAPLRERLREAGQWHERQLGARRWPMGCVALEITQRCNLDCTLCYLSPHSQAMRDVPLEEIFRRIAQIRLHYGARTGVQVTGGDPTLRKSEELVTIVRRIRELEMLPTLFTNGIRATRELLAELAENGLVDVAFHVDMTQKRRGFRNETELNTLRREYIERARGLPLRVIFNTTVCDGNLAQVPDIVRFFRAQGGAVSMASFQLQADTGRSVLGSRAPSLTKRVVAGLISAGAGVAIDFDALNVGHSECNSYAICLEAGGNLYNLCEDRSFLASMIDVTRDMVMDGENRGSTVAAIAGAIAVRPRLWGGALREFVRTVWHMRRDLIRARGRVNKLSFFIHNFMDAAQLEPERCRSCVFMVATGEGPLSMCVHNAVRDAYLFGALPGPRQEADRRWNFRPDALPPS